MRSRVIASRSELVRRVASALLGIGVLSASDEGAGAPRLCGMHPSKATRAAPSYSDQVAQVVRVCSLIFSGLSFGALVHPLLGCGSPVVSSAIVVAVAQSGESIGQAGARGHKSVWVKSGRVPRMGVSIQGRALSNPEWAKGSAIAP